MALQGKLWYSVHPIFNQILRSEEILEIHPLRQFVIVKVLVSKKIFVIHSEMITNSDGMILIMYSHIKSLVGFGSSRHIAQNLLYRMIPNDTQLFTLPFTPSVHTHITLCSSSLTNGPIELECFSLASLSILV